MVDFNTCDNKTIKLFYFILLDHLGYNKIYNCKSFHFISISILPTLCETYELKHLKAIYN